MSDFKKYIKAVRELYPNALVIKQNSETNEYTSEDSNGNVVEVNNTTVEAKIIEMQTAEDNKATAKATAQASGNTKLLALGLSQEEATAMTGYTLPVEE